MDYTDDNILFISINKGDEKAFKFLFKSYYPRLKNYLFRFVDDEEVVNDIIQDCFLSIWEKHESLQNTSLSSLLFTMARNRCLNYIKHNGLINFQHLDYLENLNGEERLYIYDMGSETDRELLINELKKQIFSALNVLPKRCKEVFILSRFKKMKNREIAEKLQISTTAVEKHISKALAYFKLHIDKNNYYVILISVYSVIQMLNIIF